MRILVEGSNNFVYHVTLSSEKNLGIVCFLFTFFDKSNLLLDLYKLLFILKIFGLNKKN